MTSCILVELMGTKIGMFIGLSTALLLFLSTYGISSVNGEPTYLKNSSFDNKTGNPDSAVQTNLDPFRSRGSDDNVNTGNSDDASLTDDKSTSGNNDDKSTSGNNDDKSTSSNNDDKSTSSNNDDKSAKNDDKSPKNDDDSDKSKSEQDKDSKSSDDGKSFELPFP
jgi:hypothetical protein